MDIRIENQRAVLSEIDSIVGKNETVIIITIYHHHHEPELALLAHTEWLHSACFIFTTDFICFLHAQQSLNHG